MRRWPVLLLAPLLGLSGCTSSAGESYWRSVSLYTHCGIRDLQIDANWFTRVDGVLDDGNGNPPSGWDNPEQRGEVKFVGDRVFFRDEHGHSEQFKPAPGNKPTTICS